MGIGVNVMIINNILKNIEEKYYNMKRLLADLILRSINDDVFALGSQLAYNLLLSFFPFIIFVMTILGHISSNNSELLLALRKIMPTSAFILVSNIISDVVTPNHGQLMSISLILTIWPASSGFNAVIKGLNKAYGVSESRNFVKVRIIAILCTIAMVFIILVMLFLLIWGRIIWNFMAYKFGFSHELFTVWTVIRYSIFISTAIVILTALYRYAPCKRLTCREALPGAVYATFELIIDSLIFAYYVNNFANYSAIYGSLGAIVVLLVWLFIVAVSVILGGEINAYLSSKIDSITINYSSVYKNGEI